MLETAFTIANASVLPFWALLIFLPGAAITRHVAQNGAIIILLGIAYAGLMGWSLVGGTGDGGGISFASLEALSAAFADPKVMLVGWIHYLAFDLFVGMWIARDARRYHVPHVLVAVCLVFTFMAGPVGAMLYLLLRAAYARSISFISS